MTHVATTATALEKSPIAEPLLRALLASSCEAIICIDNRQNIVLFNKCAEEMFGYPAGEVMGRPLDLLVPSSFRGRHRQWVENFQSGDARQRAMALRRDVMALKKDGREFPVQVSLSLTHDAESVYAVAVLRDSSVEAELRHSVVSTNAELREQSSDLETVLDAIPASIAILDQSGEILRVNQPWKHFAIRNDYADPAYGIGANYLAVCDRAAEDDETLDTVRRKLRNVLAGTSSGFEFEYDGSSAAEIRFFSLWCEPLPLSRGLGCLVVHRDVTRETIARRAANLESDLLVAMQTEPSSEKVLQVACDAIERLESTLFAGVYCFAAGEFGTMISGASLSSRYPKIARLSDAQMYAVARATETGQEIRISDAEFAGDYGAFRDALRLVGLRGCHLIPIGSHADGMRLVVCVYSTRSFHWGQDASPHYARLVDIFNVMLDRWKASVEAERARGRYALAFQASQDGLWDWDLDTGEVYRSQRCYEILGFAPRDTTTLGNFSMAEFYGTIHPDDRDGAVSILNEALRGKQGALEREFRVIGQHGKVVWVKERAVVVVNAHGAPARVIGSISDQTQQKEAEQAQRQAEAFALQAQKMEALGRLTGSIAHDFNNLLMIIGAYSTRYRDDRLSMEGLREALSEIHRAYDRGTGLTKQLLAFSRTQVLEKRVVAVADVLEGLTTLLKPLVGPSISLSIEIENRRDRIEIDASLLSQALINLIINARDAMPDGGSVGIRSSSRVVSEDEAAGIRGGKNGDFVVITVSDTGEGMDAAILDKVFEPFFTTKPVGKGTGLGLSMVYSLVNQAGGFVEVRSMVRKGTVFSLYLPRQAAGMAALDDGDPLGDALPAGRGETILLVEDEEPIRRVLQDCLEADGYRVTAVENGVEGLEAEVDAEGAFDLVLTDLVMPQMGGLEMARMILEDRPDAKIVLMTGQPARGLAQYDELLGRLPFLQKPFTPAALKRLVHDILAASDIGQAS